MYRKYREGLKNVSYRFVLNAENTLNVELQFELVDFLHQFLFLSANSMLRGWTFDERISITRDVAYGCETWPSNLTDEERLKVFENGVVRKIFSSHSEEVTTGWGNLLNKDLYELCSWSNILCLCNEGIMEGGKWVAHKRRRELHKAFCLGNRNEGDYL